MTITECKELESSETPLFLFEITLRTGDVYCWSTHEVTVEGQHYLARIQQHNMFEMRSSSDDATDGISRLSISVANADGEYSPIERQTGWKGAQIKATFLFFDLANGVAASESRVVFRGVSNPPDESTETVLRLSFTNRLNLQRILLPETRIQKRCPWTFPATAAQRNEALAGAACGKYSKLYRCGYSAGCEGGAGNLNGATPFTSCDGSRAQCIARGMFDKDGGAQITRRFGGVEFVPSSIVVRTYGDKAWHSSLPLENQARYNDYVPLAYGAGWLEPPIIFARNDGNLTHLEVLLGAGEVDSVVKVVVNDIEIPAGNSGTNMTGTGWYNVASAGARNGAFNLDFADGSGNPLGDPYGSMAVLSVVTPNQISNGRALPRVQVLMRGLKLPRFDATGNGIGEAFTNNAAWVLLDVLRRSGWKADEIDVGSFAAAAAICDEPVQTVDVHGNPATVPRYQCNLMLTRRRSAADVVRGIRNAASLYLNFNPAGKLRLNVEANLARQQNSKPEGSNSTAALNGGWPAYEFGDSGHGGIVQRGNGQSSFRVWSRASVDAPNRFSVEFQDEFNEYQQDSLSLGDEDDIAATGQEISGALAALGIPNFDQAMRVMYVQLSKSIYGNTYIDFETSVRGVTLSPGDIITVTHAKEGFERQPFRVVRVAPGQNYQTAAITAQLHEDGWYSGSGGASRTMGRVSSGRSTIPRPLVGAVLDEAGQEQFGVTESATEDSDGTSTITVTVAFNAPERPASTAVSVPLVSLNPSIDDQGGTLAGGRVYYYGLTAVDEAGAEGPLSFLVTAPTPAGTNTNRVILENLSFSREAAAFNVYRGETPAGILRIASDVPAASQFVDAGATPILKGPPDANFDHANFWWRMVLRPAQAADRFSENTIGASAAGMLANEYVGATVRIESGKGAGQERGVLGNTASTVTITPKWDIAPDASSRFAVVDSTWQFGATSKSSPVSFNAPNREGATIQISGRSANSHDEECAYELSPLTSWRISGSGGATLDADVPGQPSFGLFPTGEGGVEVLGIAFGSLSNTRTVAAGTVVLLLWDELQGSSNAALGSALAASDTSLGAASAAGAETADVLQIERELCIVESVAGDGSVTMSRAGYGTAAADHATGAAVYKLVRKTFVMPFPRDFFGSNASGSYSYRMALPDVRIAAAEFFVTNSRGNSDVVRRSFTGTADFGIRTLSGGQYAIQVEGPLAIQSDAAPPLVVDATHSVQDAFASIGTPPTGGPIDLEITRDGEAYCALTIAAGATTSNVVDGLTLEPLEADSVMGLNIIAVPQGADDSPGSDLTVTIRL